MLAKFEDAVREARAASTPLAARTVWSEFGPQLEQDSEGPIRVALCGTFTTQSLEPYLGTELLCHRLRASIRHSPYNQIHGELLSTTSTLRANPVPDVVVIVWRMEELLSGALAKLPTNPDTAREAAKKELNEFLDAIRTFLQTSNASVIVSNPMRPDIRPLGLLDARLDQGIAAVHADVVCYWRSLIASEPRIHLLDLDGAQRDFGARQAANPRMWLIAKIPWSESFHRYVGKQIARLINVLKTPARKVLVMDCDNVLWGGVAGEDGPLGVEIGEDAPGNAFAQLQRYALALRARGILLALVSKNDEAEVWEVFEKHPGMVLQRDQIAAAQINWRPKSVNLRQIAEALNLGVDSLVFIDDNPAECAEVCANAPEVLTIHLNGDPAYYVRSIEESCAFDQLTLTREDTQRAEMYAQERRREALRTGVTSMEEYLAGLGLVVRIARLIEEDVSRVTQLGNKTNQFNMTTPRRSEAEVRALWQDPAWHLFTLSVTDRFGDYGLTGIAYCVDRKEAWEIDTLLLSCRVLGRGVETALLAVLLEQARLKHKEKLFGRYIPTAKNGLAEQYYPSHSFTDIDGVYVRPTNVPLPVPLHITLNLHDL